MKFLFFRNFFIVSLVFFLIGGTFFLLEIKKTNPKDLSIMTPEERYYLDVFLQRILFFDDFSYVLFGKKPLAFTSYSNSIHLNASYDDISAENLKIKKGLEIFRKNQHHFFSHKIIVRIDDYPDGTDIFMINKKNFFRIFTKYKTDFQKILGNEITSEILLHKISEGADFGDVIGNHEALLGILLGYGRANSWLFHEKRNLSFQLDEFDLSLKNKLLVKEKFDALTQKMTFFSKTYEDEISSPEKLVIPLPHFMADCNTPETKKLKEKYGRDRNRMMKLFAKQSIRDATFKQLMRSESRTEALLLGFLIDWRLLKNEPIHEN